MRLSDVQIREVKKRDAKGMRILMNARAREGGILVSRRRVSLKETKKIINETLKRITKKKEVMFVAEYKNKIVGFCSIKQHEKRSHVGILGVLIKEKYRRKGIGAALMGKALESAKRMQIEYVELETHSGNKPALRLYKKFNFKIAAIVPKAIKWRGRYYDGITMHKVLRAFSG